MSGISNFKRVQSIIRERTSNNKLITNLYNIINVYDLNKKLMAENKEYKLQNNELVILRHKNNEYKKLLNIVNDIEFKFVTAKIISKSNLSYTKSVILMAGKNKNIISGSPVIYDK